MLTHIDIDIQDEQEADRNLTADDKTYLEGVFRTAKVYPISDAVTDQATLFRQNKKMSTGDSIIAATALMNDFDLYTNNADDFIHVPGLTVTSPA